MTLDPAVIVSSTVLVTGCRFRAHPWPHRVVRKPQRARGDSSRSLRAGSTSTHRAISPSRLRGTSAWCRPPLTRTPTMPQDGPAAQRWRPHGERGQLDSLPSRGFLSLLAPQWGRQGHGRGGAIARCTDPSAGGEERTDGGAEPVSARDTGLSRREGDAPRP